MNWINEQMRASARTETQAAGLSAPYTWVYVKNGSGSAVPRWGVLAIDGMWLPPTGSGDDAAAKQFQEMPVLYCGAPTETTTAWCVAIEPIAGLKIGRAAVAGVVQCKIEVSNENHTEVACKASASELKSVANGQAHIVWKQSGTGAGKWALIRFGGSVGVRLGTVSTAWNKNSTATVTQIKGDGTAVSPAATFTATNYFANVTVSSGSARVACAKVDDTWVLIAAEC